MGDNMKKVRSGDPLDIPAATFNTFIDSARDYLARQNNSKRQSGKDSRSSGIILIKNSSGADCERFHILGIKEPIIKPADNENQFKNRVALTGEIPALATHSGKFAILLEPLKNNALGLAMVLGVCQTKVFVEAEIHEFAEIHDGLTAYLKSAETGCAQILWKESGTGEKWAVVRFPYASGGGGTPLKLVQVTGINSASHTVATKSIIMKSDLSLTPNYTVNDSETAVSYPYLVRS